MSHLDNSETIEEPNIDFGSALRKAREMHQLSIDEVSELLKVPPRTIEAIENCKVDELPPPTFTRGYLRAYARAVEIRPENTIAAYDRAVPQNVHLNPRSNLPGETNSQSPMIRTVTYLLVVVGVMALGYGGYQYYTDKADEMKAGIQLRSDKQASQVGSLDTPVMKALPIRQNAEITADGELRINDDYTVVDLGEKTVQAQTSPVTGADEAPSPASDEYVDKNPDLTAVVIEKEALPAGMSRLRLLASKGAWCEIRNASGKRLHYDMIPKGKWFEVTGEAPFSLSLGNARSTTIKIDGLDVDMSAHIKPNNIAQFKVSVIEKNGKQVVDVR